MGRVDGGSVRKSISISDENYSARHCRNINAKRVEAIDMTCGLLGEARGEDTIP